MKISVFGLGYIGLPTATMFASHGAHVLGVDIKKEAVDTINRGHIHIVEPGLEEAVKKATDSGHLKAALTPEKADAFLIAVPTPFIGNHEADLSYIRAAATAIAPVLEKGNTVILESTSPVGATETMIGWFRKLRPDLAFAAEGSEECDIYVAYCPERVLPGNVIHELVHNDRVIGGINEESTREAARFYSHFVKGQLHPTDCKTAEMCKLTENSSRDVQIAFANELSLICDKAGINVWELISLANKHPRVNILQPGCGVGGHCIAVDPYFITSEFPLESKLIASAREINNYKSFWCAEKIQNTMLRFELENHRKPCVAMMGLAFKPNIDDLRESPAKYIATKVMQHGNNARILFVEPNIESHHVFKLTPYQEAYEQADIVAMLVAHDPFKALPYREDKIILDFCGIYKK